MKQTYQINHYEGPREREEIIRIAEELGKRNWPTKVYTESSEIAATIYGIIPYSYKGKKNFITRELGEIITGKIITHNRDKSLEDFLAKYSLEDLKGGKK